MNVELYARTSTKDGRQTPELQIEELRRYAAQRSWTIVRETIEEESGVKARPKFEAVLQRIEAGEAKAVLSVELSRFGRSMPHLVQISERLKAAGAELVATRQQIDTTTPTGRLMFGILAALAQFERELIQERVTAGVRRAIGTREGAWGRARAGIPLEALQQASNHVHKAGLTWAAAAECLFRVGYAQAPRTQGKRQHSRRPWPTGTLRDAVRRVGLPFEPSWEATQRNRGR